MKKLLLSFMLIMTIVFLTACEEDRSYTIDEVTIDAVISEDGTIHVQEQYTYTFDGSFNGLTRSIHSNEKNFQAFTANNKEIGEPLVVDFDEEEELYKIFQAATDETKSVIYTYDIHGSVAKYTDTNKLAYQFFDSENESDLHHLTISIQTDITANSDKTYGYVRENSNGRLEVNDGILRYTNELLQAGEDSLITFLFPEETTPQLQLKKNKDVLQDELQAMNDWQERADQLPAKMAEMKPVLYIILIAMSAIVALVLFLHPNRARKYMDDESLQQLLESTDPVFIDYVNNYLTIRPNAVMYSLFSLKMRKVVRMEEVDSILYENEKTIRFTWLRSNISVDAADEHLKSWLFTDKTNGMPSFLLETVLDDPDDPEKVREEKGEAFDEQFSIWEELVQTRPEYEKVRNPYRMYPWISILFIVITAGVFYTFLTFDQITIKEMFWLQIVLAMISLIALFGAKYKFITPFYYMILIILSFVFLTITETTIVAIAIFMIAAIATLSIPAFVWTDEVGQLKKAVNQTYHRMFKQQYPLARNVETVENQLLYAVVLDVGKPFARQLGQDDFVSQLTNDSIFAFQPDQFVAIDGVSNPMFYSAIALNNASSSSTTTTTSSTGGGGAGAF